MKLEPCGYIRFQLAQWAERKGGVGGTWAKAAADVWTRPSSEE